MSVMTLVWSFLVFSKNNYKILKKGIAIFWINSALHATLFRYRCIFMYIANNPAFLKSEGFLGVCDPGACGSLA